MRIAVFGSWPSPGNDSPDWSFIGSEDDFRAACRELGAALAERGHTLLVESDDEHVADRHVVEGYVARARAGTGSAPKVELAWPRGRARPFEALAQANPGWFRYHQIPSPTKGKATQSHITTLRACEAVLTVGGLHGTYTAGLAALLARRPLAPVACFSGASARLLDDLREDRGGALPEAAMELLGPWGRNALEAALGLLGGPTVSTALFVSHAHRDQALAKALVELIRAAFDVPTDAIRCTSVPGYQLPPAAHISDQLRDEVEASEFVLALVTPGGVRSAYVLFELGAAWGLRRRAIPLLAHGFGPHELPGPLAERNPVDLASAAQCHDLLAALEGSRLMRRKKESAALVQGYVDDLVAAAKAAPAP